MTAKENRTKYLFFPPRRKFLSIAVERKDFRDGKNKQWYTKVLRSSWKSNRNAKEKDY